MCKPGVSDYIVIFLKGFSTYEKEVSILGKHYHRQSTVQSNYQRNPRFKVERVQSPESPMPQNFSVAENKREKYRWLIPYFEFSILLCISIKNLKHYSLKFIHMHINDLFQK